MLSLSKHAGALGAAAFLRFHVARQKGLLRTGE